MEQLLVVVVAAVVAAAAVVVAVVADMDLQVVGVVVVVRFHWVLIRGLY